MSTVAFDARSMWRRWIVMNGLAEFVGLTSTMAMTAGLFAVNDDLVLSAALAAAAGVALAGAAVEGVAVGMAQWSVLRTALPELSWRPWVQATAIGAFVAWMLGMMPSTFFAATATATDAAASADVAAFDPSLALQMGLAVMMGAALGPFLGVPQWFVLRKHVPRAGRWVLANSVAWAAGMPMIFLATSLIGTDWTNLAILATVSVGCLAAGLVVGAVHGWWLVRMLADA